AGAGQALMTRLFQAIGIGTSGGSPMGLVKMGVGMLGDEINGRVAGAAMSKANVDPFEVIRDGTEFIKQSFSEKEASTDRLIQYAGKQAQLWLPEQRDEAMFAAASLESEVLDLKLMKNLPTDALDFANGVAAESQQIYQLIDEVA